MKRLRIFGMSAVLAGVGVIALLAPVAGAAPPVKSEITLGHGDPRRCLRFPDHGRRDRDGHGDRLLRQQRRTDARSSQCHRADHVQRERDIADDRPVHVRHQCPLRRQRQHQRGVHDRGDRESAASRRRSVHQCRSRGYRRTRVPAVRSHPRRGRHGQFGQVLRRPRGLN